MSVLWGLLAIDEHRIFMQRNKWTTTGNCGTTSVSMCYMEKCIYVLRGIGYRDHASINKVPTLPHSITLRSWGGLNWQITHCCLHWTIQSIVHCCTVYSVTPKPQIVLRKNGLLWYIDRAERFFFCYAKRPCKP